MLVETIIKDSCTYLTPAPEFFLASLNWFNHAAANQQAWPVCLMENVTPSNTTITPAMQGISVFDVSVLFLHSYPVNDLQDVEHDPEYGGTRHTAIDNMRTLADNLLQVMARDTRILKPSDDIIGARVQSVYNFMDLNLDGAHLTFSLRLYSNPYCVDKHSGPKV